MTGHHHPFDPDGRPSHEPTPPQYIGRLPITADHSRRRWLSSFVAVAGFGLGVVAIGGLAALIGWLAAVRNVTVASRRVRLTVSGASMAPTLWGPHAELSCPHCGLTWSIHWQPELRPQAAVICWNCGGDVPIDAAKPHPGTTVWLEPWTDFADEAARKNNATDKPRRGDLVAIDGFADTSGVVVKRVVALPGETVSETAGELFVDGIRIDEHLLAVTGGERVRPDRLTSTRPAWIPVHDDRFRRDGESRWFAERDWLVYQHHDVYHGRQPDVIRDDFPANASEVRRLEPVERIGLSLSISAARPGRLTVVFRIAGHTTTVERRLRPGDQQLWLDSAVGERWLDGSSSGSRVPPTELSRPVALRVTGTERDVSRLMIWRPPRYRCDVDAGGLRLPLRLGHQEYFVLGDNSPLSVDSRHFGPIPQSRIVGRIGLVG